MYKIYFFLLLSFIFFSANSYAYDENYDIKKEVCKEDIYSCEYINFLCNIKSKDNNNFYIELRKKFPMKSPVRYCECTKDSSKFFKTSYLCECGGNIPFSKNRFNFEWYLLGSREMTCNHFINVLYDNDYAAITKDMIKGPTF